MFDMSVAFRDGELLPERLHRDQMLAANGFVVYAWIEVRYLDRDIDRCDGVGGDQMDVAMTDAFRQI